MGCGASRVGVLPDSQAGLPEYCVRGATLSVEQRRLLTSSWEACMRGTRAGSASLGDAEPTDDVAASSLSSLRVQQSITKSPIVLFYDSFYDRLFELCPNAQGVFPSSLHARGRKLVEMVKWIVVLLGDSQKSATELRALAERHVKYGARLEHFGPVGQALLFALETCCGPEVWTPQVAQAWLLAYSVVVAAMIPAQIEAQNDAIISASSGSSGSLRFSAIYH